MIALKTNVVKWEIVCEKIHFADPVKDAKSVAGFFPPANLELDRMMQHKHGLATKTVSKWRPSKSTTTTT